MKKYKSPALKHIHEGASHFFEEGIINAAEMKEFDKDCLVSPVDTPTVRAPRVTAMAASPRLSKGRSIK
jgi:putative transcriptional regulator